MLKVNHIQKNYSHFNLNCSFDVPIVLLMYPKAQLQELLVKAVQEKQHYLNLF